MDLPFVSVPQKQIKRAVSWEMVSGFFYCRTAQRDQNRGGVQNPPADVAMCIIGLEGTMIRPGPMGPTHHTKDAAAQRDTHQAGAVDPLLVEAVAATAPRNGSNSSGLSATDRHRRLIPYMQYYVTSTAGPPSGGTDNADYQPSFNQVYNYRPIVSIALCMQIARIKVH
uniref:Uncharacterized protein n=1 Tax=Anopheles maculatus TaxID=74869 RepID=A0A182TA21_9DIPT